MQILRSRLFDLELQKQQAEISARRKSQVRHHALTSTLFVKQHNVWKSAVSLRRLLHLLNGMQYGCMHCSQRLGAFRADACRLSSSNHMYTAHTHMTPAAQVGTGSRSEKIKTYNYKDSRVSDHRCKTNFSLDGILAGDLNECIDAMTALDQQEQLQVLLVFSNDFCRLALVWSHQRCTLQHAHYLRATAAHRYAVRLARGAMLASGLFCILLQSELCVGCAGARCRPVMMECGPGGSVWG